MFKNLLKQDYILTILIIVLMSIGIVTIYSTGQSYEGIRQLIFAILGIIAYFAFTTIDYKIYKDKKVQVLIYLGIFALLALIFILNIRLNNTRRWFVIGKLSIQPAEFAKLVIILISASFFEIFRKSDSAIKKIGIGLAIWIHLILYLNPISLIYFSL